MKESLQGLVPRREQCFQVEIPNSALDYLHSSDFQCNVPLGMESGRIANEQISASSTYSDGRWRPQQSRLHGDDNDWTMGKQYQQLNLGLIIWYHFLKIQENHTMNKVITNLLHSLQAHYSCYCHIYLLGEDSPPISYFTIS